MGMFFLSGGESGGVMRGFLFFPLSFFLTWWPNTYEPKWGDYNQKKDGDFAPGLAFCLFIVNDIVAGWLLFFINFIF